MKNKVRINDRIMNNIDKFHEEHFSNILFSLYGCDNITNYKPSEIISIIGTTLLEFHLKDNKNYINVAESFSEDILNLEVFKDYLFNKFDSSYETGLALLSLALTFINYDEFSYKSILEAIEEDDFTAEDLDTVLSAKISRIPPEAIDKIHDITNAHKKETQKKKSDGLDYMIEAYKKDDVSISELLKYINVNNIDIEKLLERLDVDETVQLIKEIKLINLLNKSFKIC